MRSLESIGDNDRANEVAYSLGFKRGAEELKGDYVQNGQLYDMKIDTDNYEIVLVKKNDSRIMSATGLYVRR